MNNQQTTLKEYAKQTECAIVTSRAAIIVDVMVKDLEYFGASMEDDHGYPISGDHLSKTRLKMELNSLYGKNVN